MPDILHRVGIDASDEKVFKALSRMVKKLVPVAAEQELSAHCSAPFEDKAGPGGLFGNRRFPASFIYAIDVLRAHRPLSRRLLCRFLLVIL